MPTNRPVMQELAGEERNPARRWIGDLAPFDDDILNERLGGRFEIYRKLLADSQVRSVFQQRRLAVVAKEWIVEPGGSGRRDKMAADFIREQLQSIPWDGITDKMLYGLFYGFAVAECLWARDGGRVVIDPTRREHGEAGILIRKRERFRFEDARLGGRLRLLVDANDYRGERMPERKFWTYAAGDDNSDNPYGLGLANTLYWPVKFKRNGLDYWLVFLDKCGTPTPMAQLPAGIMTSQSDDARRQREAVRDALAAIQSDSGIMVPDTAVITLLEAKSSSVSSFDQLYDRMDKAISKIILSQTMTSDDGSSLAQAKVHEDVSDLVVKADADLISKSFVAGPVGWLTEWNFEGAAVPQVWRKVENEEDLGETAKRDQTLIDMGYRPGLQYIKDTYGQHWEQPAADRGIRPGLSPPPPEFRELPDEIARRVHRHRRDQSDIKELAVEIANHYEDLLGERVRELEALLDETGDLATFRERLNELIHREDREPPEVMVRTAERVGVTGRLLGLLRGQV